MKRPVGITFLIMLGLVLTLFLSGATQSGDGTLPLPGYRAPEFSLPTVDGEFQLSETRGKPVVLNFWASWCYPCRIEMPDLQRLHERYGDQVTVVGVNLRESRSTVAKYVQEHGYGWTFALDLDGRVNELYRIHGIPVSVFIDRKGVIRNVHQGPMSYALMHRYLDDLLR